MAVHRGNKKYRNLNMSDTRCLRKYAHFINQKLKVNFNSFSRTEIENALDNYNQDENMKYNFIYEMANDCNSSLLKKEELYWIKDDDRACNWVWLTLKCLSSEILSKLSNPNEENRRHFFPTPTFGDVISVKRASSTAEHGDEIIEFFDLWNASIFEKQNLLNNLKKTWSEITPQKIELKWLDEKNEEQCNWTWGYIFNSELPTDNLTPLTLTDRYDSIYASLDFWNAHPDSKVLFCQKLKKAWDQKAFRKRQGNKVPLNTYISKESREMLRSIAKKRDQKIHETLESIIRNAFSDL